MAAILFGRTQQAIQTPFQPLRNPGFGGVAQPFTSTDVQNAIEEGLSRAIANDRFVVLPQYGGNANVGRYLEIFSNQASDVSPIFLSAAAKLLTVTLQTTAATATADVGLFDLNVSSTVPVYTVVINNQKRVQYTGSPSAPLATFSPMSLFAIRVIAGSINTPTMQVTLSAST